MSGSGNAIGLKRIFGASRFSKIESGARQDQNSFQGIAYLAPLVRTQLLRLSIAQLLLHDLNRLRDLRERDITHSTPKCQQSPFEWQTSTGATPTCPGTRPVEPEILTLSFIIYPKVPIAGDLRCRYSQRNSLFERVDSTCRKRCSL